MQHKSPRFPPRSFGADFCARQWGIQLSQRLGQERSAAGGDETVCPPGATTCGRRTSMLVGFRARNYRVSRRHLRLTWHGGRWLFVAAVDARTAGEAE